MSPQAKAGVPGRLPEVAHLPCNPDSAEGLAGLPGVIIPDGYWLGALALGQETEPRSCLGENTELKDA